ncbi:organic solute transporter Ostalpha-domain-containing protein [Lentinula aciculospora]|uniref:Organic solute transporter Ostalpha-domain-containing protein n=1 Tax=Lentinula aciculospora TaxID=153920 RepID=A0A9W9AK71_9AGAR|nr:organic solute transporter Ostalpha-domain-containing protein [Lentinula aciculospora]
MSNITDGRCWKEIKPNSPSLLQNGNLVFQAHHVGWIVAGFFTVIAIITSAWLINKHLLYYTNKREQRYIVRILFMVPIYAIISMASYLFWNHSTPLLLIRDGYESTVLTSFFYLLLNYLSHDPDEQRTIFLKNGLSRVHDREALRKGEAPSRWIFPLGFVNWKPADGLLFLQMMKWGVLQYCVIRPTTTLAAVLLNYSGLYCEDSWGLGWGHSYITVIVSISVTVAMYCLIQLYVPVSKILAPQKPLLKLFSVKAIVFLTFWQATFLSLLSMVGVIKDTTYMTADDINIGIGALLETFEMMLFGFLHIKAFTYKPYLPNNQSQLKDLPAYRMSRLRALGHAMDFRETFRELWIGIIYLWEKMRGRDPRPDINARRVAHYENAFEPTRPPGTVRKEQNEKADPLILPMIRVEKEYYDDTHGRQWLGHGNDYGYGIHREKSDDLEVQIERELERRGYGYQVTTGDLVKPDVAAVDIDYSHQPQKSWWRSIYNRISQSGPEDDGASFTFAHSRHTSRRKSKSNDPSKPRSRNPSRDLVAECDVVAGHRYNVDDLPPPSLFRSKRLSAQSKLGRGAYSPVTPYGDEDMLAPLSVFNNHQNSSFQRQAQHRISVNKQGPNIVLSSPTTTDHPPRNSHSPPPSSPPPPSLLAPLMSHGGISVDSLLGRVFPSKSSDANLTAHGTDNTHSTGYVYTVSRTALPSREGGFDIGMANERNPVLGQASLSSNIPQAMTASLINPMLGANADGDDCEVISEHQGNVNIERRLVPPAVQHTIPTYFTRMPSPAPRPAPSETRTRPSPGLRRSSAQVYSLHESTARKHTQVQPSLRTSPSPSQSRRHSIPAVLTIPRPLAPPADTYSGEQSNRYSLHHTHTPRYSIHNSSNTIISNFHRTSQFLPSDLSPIIPIQEKDYSRRPARLSDALQIETGHL